MIFNINSTRGQIYAVPHVRSTGNLSSSINLLSTSSVVLPNRIL